MFENISASYDVGIAKKYGINCAVLLNKLIYLSKYTSRKDGYCWRTSKELEDELGLSRYQQDVAIKKLIEENLIETKNTYIIGTQIKCKHFKLLFDINKCDLQETNKSIDCRKTNICDLQETNKSVNNNTINNNTSNNNKYIYMGIYKRIKLTKEQYNKLIEDYGENYINQIIIKLDEYVESNNNKNKYSNYNLVIRKAIRDNWFKIEKLPSWFNKETEMQRATIEEQQEMEEMLKKYR